MKIPRRSNRLMRTIFLGLVLLLAVPTVSFAQGRGHGRGRGRGLDLDDKKCGKFVNCHDARDGRWDGRGPNRGTRISDRDRYRRYGRVIDNDIIYSRSRIRRDRDGDGDFDRNDIRLERQRRMERRYRRWNP